MSRHGSRLESSLATRKLAGVTTRTKEPGGSTKNSAAPARGKLGLWNGRGRPPTRMESRVTFPTRSLTDGRSGDRLILFYAGGGRDLRSEVVLLLLNALAELE